jgi:hypothetical protein
MMVSIRKRTICAAALAVLLAAQVAPALINPNFTPVHLVAQADRILVLRVAETTPERIRFAVQRTIKGQAPGDAVALDLAATEAPDHAKALAARFPKLGDRDVVLVSGKNDRGQVSAFLHVTPAGELGTWYSLAERKDKGWSFLGLNTHMQDTWSGGTDMFIGIADRLVKHPDLSVPCVAGVEWMEENQKVGVVSGRVSGVRAVDLDGDGKLTLYVASDKGDRLFRYSADAEKFEDITAARKLDTASRAFAWCDLNADGRADLVTLDGARMELRLQNEQGVFATKKTLAVPDGECLGLSIVMLPGWPTPRVLWSGAKGPVLVSTGQDAPPSPLKLGPPTDVSGFGVPYACLVADFDGDGRPDALWPFEKGSVLFRGMDDGSFAAGTPAAVRIGGKNGGCFLGDYDADGLFDVFAVSESSCMIWQNRGDGVFEETLVQSGEIEHVYSGAGAGGNTCDFNNDGIQDVFIFYANRAPHLFFNRGFRSFGHAHMLDLTEAQRLLPAHAGQQAGIVADFDHDTAQDMALVLRNGDVYILARNWTEDPLALRVCAKASKAGCVPLRVTGANEWRKMGAWNVVPGGSEAFFGVIEPGVEVTVKWHLPGGKEQSKNILVEDKPKRVLGP